VLARTAPTVHSSRREQGPLCRPVTVGEALLRGLSSNASPMRDAGLTYYGNGIAVATTTIASKPDLAHRFVEATVRDMKDTFAGPAAAGATIQNRSIREERLKLE
jgi:hypothetical protein